MRRLLVGILLVATLGVVAPAPAQAAQVFCRVPTNHQVVCFNYTPYRVHMYVVVRTAAGPRYFSFWNAYTVWRHYFIAYVYSVTWRWHY